MVRFAVVPQLLLGAFLSLNVIYLLVATVTVPRVEPLILSIFGFDSPYHGSPLGPLIPTSSTKLPWIYNPPAQGPLLELITLFFMCVRIIINIL
ncbi:hypothetical protein BJV82DRAFT_340107 [Fennellomyces sp. T-0311]|nr:hypothetical protein BJV82DRAFT_340107 [Fennellomyces sp. T-0311]